MGKIILPLGIIGIVILSGCLIPNNILSGLNLCGFLEEGQQQYDCYMLKAETDKDFAVCENISDSSHKIFCYEMVSNLVSDPNACEAITGQENKDACYSSISIEKRTVEDCDKIMDLIIRENCYRKLGSFNVDATLCEKITSDNRKSSCYARIAVKENDFSFCSYLEGDWEDECYVQAAVDLRTLDGCYEIENIEHKEDCFTFVAFRTKDKSLCEEISDPDKKDYCQEAEHSVGKDWP